jgi:hypothetical protein
MKQNIFQKEMASYTPPETAEEVPEDSKKKKAKKDPNTPKKALSAYFCFSAAESKKIREANPGMTVLAVAKVSSLISAIGLCTKLYLSNL